ncbi:MAG: alcohol dehydrogenase catalytic domain-containing protein [Rhodospirillales bacterium]|jgi:(R,R)-butanediol dehydrogenase/meso-butanediol dehydrogenase/diacetyl reductase|nr:Zn-dependent alcohol dehydrogenase [Rhodospirillaceae bacterium]MDP6427470.1 alcohol dehydrogenase catalytic domain-containing protein [Rhodospirillales bacterium]MDP6643823.1 alcohol dehydrogenase catalytic domain-containing protein [Rhodospirillales bacterium]MDP6843631.1 alcohol dehydrogenase catalytic domain-containing protein [Rhodospirillales bacterium]
MKAAVFKERGQPLAIEDIADPTPGPGEVVLEVGRCGICGSDLHVTDEPSHLAPFGKVLGHEYAGQVIAIGKGVERIKTGDNVAVMPLSSCGQCANCLGGEPAWCAERQIDGGGYAQFSLTHERQCVKLPATLSMEDGALVEPMAVGLHTVAQSGLGAGDRVLVYGAGPIGLATVFWLKRMGAGMIAVTARTTQRKELALQMGADLFVTPSDDPPAAAIEAMGGPADIVFECVGVSGLLQQSILSVRMRGTVVLAGLCFHPDSIVPAAAVVREARIQPAAFYSLAEFQHAAEPLDQGAVEPAMMVTDTVDLSDMPPVFEALRERTTQCKVMVKP